MKSSIYTMNTRNVLVADFAKRKKAAILFLLLFIPSKTDISLTKVYPEFLLAIEAAVIVDNNLNYCRCIDKKSHFCNFYYSMISC